ncbi:MAG TPA: hypothetical protein VFR21_28500 [Bradyrhizobium sp.]|jgi:hypothetical protein|nr:hypothetical protein [Bradyrhizobium sp.]
MRQRLAFDGMRRFPLQSFAALFAPASVLLPLHPAVAQVASLQCFSTDQTREEIESARLVQPFVLMRRAAGDLHAEAIDGRLCRWNNELIYEISLLRRDGHIVRVHFNAANGKAVERR